MQRNKRKSLTNLLVVSMVLVAASSFIAFFSQGAGSSDTVARSVKQVIPDTLQRIFQYSCVGCHGEGGNAQAMKRLDFSHWYSYGHGKQVKKSLTICNALKKGTMPPLYIREATPEKVPTPAQIDMICDWAAAAKNKK